MRLGAYLFFLVNKRRRGWQPLEIYIRFSLVLKSRRENSAPCKYSLAASLLLLPCLPVRSPLVGEVKIGSWHQSFEKGLKGTCAHVPSCWFLRRTEFLEKNTADSAPPALRHLQWEQSLDPSLGVNTFVGRYYFSVSGIILSYSFWFRSSSVYGSSIVGGYCVNTF